ncbi:MAG: SDR family oxidoreductase [Anaerolineales bacterium]|jgi:NAD(P)-dependent dehydrogenase (short-subunit alcohol dehydrogenase family)
MMNSLRDSVAFVTGAGRGVGRAIAILLARQGVKVALQDITPDNLAETLRMIRSDDFEALELVGDMSKKMQVQSMIEQTREALGEINLLVNQWSVAPEASLLAIDEWDWDRTLGINLKGYFLAIQSIGRIMSDQKQGAILNVVVPPTRFQQSKNYPAYEVSVAGVRELTRQAARELTPMGVQVLTVQAERKGSMHQAADEDSSEDALAWWQLDPSVFASMVVEICSRSNQYPSGRLLVVRQDRSVYEQKIT